MIDVFLLTRGMAFGLVLLLCMKIWRDYRLLLTGRLLLMLLGCLGVYLLMPFLDAMPILFHLMVIPATLVPTGSPFWRPIRPPVPCLRSGFSGGRGSRDYPQSER